MILIILIKLINVNEAIVKLNLVFRTFLKQNLKNQKLEIFMIKTKKQTLMNNYRESKNLKELFSLREYYISLINIDAPR